MAKQIGPIEIMIRAVGADAVAGAFRRVAAEADSLGRDLKQSGTGGAAALSRVETEARQVDRALSQVGQNQGLSTAATNAQNLARSTDDAASHTEALQDKLTTLRDVGAGLALGGAAVLLLSNNLQRAAAEGGAADAKLEAMFKKRGEGGRVEELSQWASKLSMDAAMVDDDPIKEAAAGLAGFGVNADQVKGIMPGLIGQARLYGQSLESVSEAFGRAFAKGDVGGLRRSGVTISEADEERIKAITDEGERQKATYEAVKQSMEQYALGLTEGLTEAEIASNRVKNQMDSLQTTIGEGAASAHMAIQVGLIAPLLDVANAHPGLLKTAGGIMEIGGHAATVTGSVLTLASQVGLAKLGFDAMGVSSVAAFLKMKVGAIGANAAMLPLLLTIGKIALVAILAAAAIYALDKLAHKKEDEELKKNIAAGDATDEERLRDINETRAKQGKTDHDRQAITLEQLKAWEADESGSTDPLGKQRGSADFDPEAAKAALTDAMKGGGAPGTGFDSEDSGDGLSATVATPGAAPSLLGSGAASPGVDEDAETNPHEAELRKLKRQKRDLKGKSNAAARDALQKQIDDLDDKSRAWKKTHASQTKAAKLAEKEAKEAEKKADQTADYAVDLEVAREDAKGRDYIARIEDERDKAKEDRDGAAVEAYTLQIETYKAEAARYRAQAEADKAESTDKAKRDFLYQKSEIEFESDMNQARRAAKRAGRDAEDSGGKGDKAKRDASLRRALLAMQEGAGAPVFGGAALNPAGSGVSGRDVYDMSGNLAEQKTDRFDRSKEGGFWNGERIEALESLWNGGEVGGGYSGTVAGVPGAGDFGQSGSRQSNKREFQARGQRTTQDFNGDYRIKFDDIVIPYQGIGNLRGDF